MPYYDTISYHCAPGLDDRVALVLLRRERDHLAIGICIVGYEYGQFSEFHVCFCGLDSGNLKFETVRTTRRHICF